MAITPAGAPVWVRSNDHTTYGGDPNKRNYQSQGVVDPTTDVSAEQFSRLVEDVAALGRVTEFCTITFLCNDSAPAAPTILFYDGLAGSEPTGARVGNGNVTFTFAGSYTDAYSVSGLFHAAHADATVQSATAAFPTTTVSDVDANGRNEVVGVKVWDSAGAAVLDATVTLTVWTSTV